MASASASSFLPKSVLALRHYSLDTFRRDLVAGITVGLVALPLAMAFAIASGLSPQQGIYCAVVTGFIISALGGSTVQIGGPTGAFVVVVAGIVNQYGVGGLYVCTLMAGLMLIVIFAVKLAWLPLAGIETLASTLTGWERVLDIARHLVLPTVSLALIYVAIYMRLMRAGMLEVYGLDFVRTAKAKGLTDDRIAWRHVLPNALVATLTFVPFLLNASITDCVFEMKRPTTAEEVNNLFRDAAAGPLAGILGYEERPLVSADYARDTRSSIVDAPSTIVTDGTMLKVYAWYDNEMGYACRMVDLACHLERMGL